MLFAAGELKFAHDLPLRQEIEEDLGSFMTQTTAAGNMVISQSRNASGHGDLGIGLIRAAFASQCRAPQSIKVSHLRGWYGNSGCSRQFRVLSSRSCPLPDEFDETRAATSEKSRAAGRLLRLPMPHASEASLCDNRGECYCGFNSASFINRELDKTPNCNFVKPRVDNYIRGPIQPRISFGPMLLSRSC
ncbi:hypothetical protein AB9K34_24005 [Sedimentitalea sp. XS_ASV28]